ncbi:hypothetical protein VTJ83DRAFT_5695 [Remersonia thermophila]|uniref:UBC core domain-containing protein n=1 Tax=Remersonia thermophila TaxID=72144 RepID=A0ABR4D7N4_9PEZI
MASPTPKFNSKSPTIRRILREAHELTVSPSADYHAAPLETDLFEWHFTLRGPPRSAFERGIYHGRITLPPTYPLRPPSFRFLTPSGRFEPNREICLSISGHHEETWQPAWGVRTALVALRSFMETDPKGQLGGVDASDEVRRRLAEESRGWKCGVCGAGRSNEEVLQECEERVKEREEQEGASKEKEEEKVPEELRMVFRDDLEKEREAGENGKGKEADDGESDALAEGFVQTVPRPDTTAATSAAAAAAAAAAAPVVANPTWAAPAQPQLAVQQRPPIDETALWLDRLIVAVAILLAAVVLKVMLA